MHGTSDFSSKFSSIASLPSRDFSTLRHVDWHLPSIISSLATILNDGSCISNNKTISPPMIREYEKVQVGVLVIVLQAIGP